MAVAMKMMTRCLFQTFFHFFANTTFIITPGQTFGRVPERVVSVSALFTLTGADLLGNIY